MSKSIFTLILSFQKFALNIALLIFAMPLFAKAQQVKTYMRGEVIQDGFYQLFTDAGRFGDLKKGEIVLITGIEKEYFRFDYKDNRSVVTLKTNFRNPDSLVKTFINKIKHQDSLDLVLKNKATLEEQEKIQAVNSYLKKYGTNIDRYCFKEKKIMIGMSALIFGWVKREKPLEINRTTTKYGTDEQWVYPKYVYYYFTNRKLTAIQD